MSRPDKFRKLRSDTKPRISQVNQGNGGTHAGPATPGSGASPRWIHLRTFVRALEQATRPLPPLKAVMSELAESLGIHNSLLRERNEYETLHAELEDLFQTLQHHCTEGMPPSITTTVEALCKLIQGEIAGIGSKKFKGKLRDYLEVEQAGNEILACYRRVQGHLQCLSLNVDMSLWRIVNKLATDNRLNRLASSLSACYNSTKAVELKRGPCTKGTRVDLLSQMLSWVDSPSPESVYWMSGMAGTGKTTIAYSLCEELDANRRLGASFFCSRLSPECRNVNLIIPSVAYQLARASLPFRFALAGVLEKDPDVHTRLPHLQFSALLAQPLLEVGGTLPSNLVVVVDALDECDNKESTSQILDILLTEGANLPLKFIVCSRPEPEIRDEMAKQGNPTDSRVVLHELDRCTVRADIETYLRATLAQMKPTEEQILKVVEQAGILFIYAATVIRYVGYDRFRRNPHARLANVLESSSKSDNKHKAIDELYTTILQAALDDPNLESTEKQDMQQVLHTVICAQESLTVDVISRLLRINDTGRVHATLRPLWSVLHISGASELVTTLHASFPDYMLNLSRSKQYHCDQRVHNQTVAHLCFDLYRDVGPQFNICGLESSYMADEEVEGLEERVKSAISTELFYASRYWAVHLQHASGSPDLVRQLDEFLSTRLLLWIEVMNLKKCAGSMPEMLRLVEKWEVERSTELDELIHDAWRFASTFALGAVAESTPHIYVTMLSLWPELSQVSRRYKGRARGLIRTEGAAIDRQDHALLATWSFGSHIQSPKFSPDGTQIAVGVGRQVLIINSSTGQAILPPLETHQEPISCVRFSPDGSRIVTSDGHAMYIWSTQTAKGILGPIRVDVIFDILEVAFAPDGASVISLSQSNSLAPPGPLFSIVIWDALGAKRILNSPYLDLVGADMTTASITGSFHKPCVVFGYQQAVLIYDSQGVWTRRKLSADNSNHSLSQVEISPDGALVAGVKGRNIYVWDLGSESTVLGPLGDSWFGSISFSPNGSCLAASSSDGVRIWDVRNGELVVGPLQEYATMFSLCFSPDGTYVICSTLGNDNRLCLWDARSRHTLLDSPQGRRNSVFSVDFSPDGTRLISGSSDGTASVWDAESGEMVLGPLERTTCSGLAPPAFSPEGSCIILPRNTGLVLLDAQTGNVTNGPFQSEHGAESVAISPDGTYIAIVEELHSDPHVRILATDTGRVLWSTRTDKANGAPSIFFSVSTQLVICSPYISDNTGCLCVYDSQSGELLNQVTGHFNWFRLSSDGARIVSIFESRVISQDIITGAQLFGPRLEGHTNTFRRGEFSPDCAQIALANGRTIFVWDARTGQRVLGPVKWHTSNIYSVKFSPDSRRVVSGSTDNTIRVTDIQVAPNLTPGSSPDDFGEWELREDGWVVDESSKRLVWIPTNLRTSLMFPRTKLLISRRGHLRLNFEGVHIGASWAKCYRAV